MIGEIIINNVATYNLPASLNDLRRINYIFGANGTGKTTIGRVIAQAEGHDHCRVAWQGAIPLEVMVYNRDFVERNFNQNSPLQGVFTLGENQVEAEREIASLQPQIERVRDQIATLNNQLDGVDDHPGKRKELADLEPVVREKCWKQKELHDSYFMEAFATAKVRGDKERFKEKVLSERTLNAADLFTLDELKDKARTVFASGVERVSSLASLNGESLIAAESHELLQKAIVGNQEVDIADLINRLGNSDWVKQGRKYHDQDHETCPFCQQSTEGHFAESLALFFSEAYDDDMADSTAKCITV